MSKYRAAEIIKDATGSDECDHDLSEIIDSQDLPSGFEEWGCCKCGNKFIIPKGESV